MAEFHEAGILRAIQPVIFGGFEADFINQIDLTYEISRACGASGWVYAVLSAHAAMIANFPERAQQEVWGVNPRALASSSLSFDRDGSSELPAATSSAATGAIRAAATYCAYLVGGADAEEADETGRRARRRFLLPIAQLEIIDDWHVIGLAGTGSKSLRGKEVFVPEWLSLTDREFLTNTGPGRTFHDHSHLYRLSRFAHPGPLSLAMAAVGIAQHAVDYCTEHLGEMGVGRTSAVEREVIRHDLAESAAEVDAARLLIRRTVQEIERAGKERIDPVPPALDCAGQSGPSLYDASRAESHRAPVPRCRLARTVRGQRAAALLPRRPCRGLAGHPPRRHNRRPDRPKSKINSATRKPR